MFRKVENKGRYKTAQGYYWYIKSENKDYLFTESALEEAEKRAQKNPEDIPVVHEEASFTTGLVSGFISGALSVTALYFFLSRFGGF